MDEQSLAKEYHRRICANVDAWCDGAITYDEFSARARCLWKEIERAGSAVKANVHAIINGRLHTEGGAAMSAKYTPGPWYARGESVEAQRPHVCGGTNHESVFALARDPSERRANARLAAAAPDLLAALKECAEWIESEHAWPLGLPERVRAAIARAEGGTR